MKKIIFFIIIVFFNSCKDNNTTQPLNNDPNVVIYGGKTYHTVQIGNQIWLKENLDVGTMIPGNQNASNNGTIEKHCYDNDPANCAAFGGLYRWEEAMQYVVNEGAKGICPNGWHIPTMAEWNTLIETIQNNGNSLKAKGQGTATGAGTDSTGFSALLGGYSTPSGYFYDKGTETHFWSTTPSSSSGYYKFLYLNDDENYISSGISTKNYGFSVRCLKD